MTSDVTSFSLSLLRNQEVISFIVSPGASSSIMQGVVQPHLAKNGIELCSM